MPQILPVQVLIWQTFNKQRPSSIQTHWDARLMLGLRPSIFTSWKLLLFKLCRCSRWWNTNCCSRYPLLLPLQCIHVIKNHNLLKYKWEFCCAQANETLGNLHGLILLWSHMYKSKGKYSRGQEQQPAAWTFLLMLKNKSKEWWENIEEFEKLSSPSLLHYSSSCGQWHSEYFKIIIWLDWRQWIILAVRGQKKLTWIWSVQGTGVDVNKLTQAGMSVFSFSSV